MLDFRPERKRASQLIARIDGIDGTFLFGKVHHPSSHTPFPSHFWLHWHSSAPGEGLYTFTRWEGGLPFWEIPKKNLTAHTGNYGERNFLFWKFLQKEIFINYVGRSCDLLQEVLWF